MSTGKTYSTKYLLDSNNNRGAAGQVLSTTSTGIDWVDANTVPGSGLWLASGNNIYNSNSGNVGIGTTSPQTKLEVNGGLVKVVDSGDTAFYGGDYVRVFGTQSYGFRNTAGSTIAQISLTGNSYFNGGNVGIGTNIPGEKLSVTGNIEINVGAASAQGLIFNENGTQTMGIKYQGGQSGNPIDIFRYQDDTTKVRFLENGNVGIGTTSPGTKLHISGNSALNDTSTQSLLRLERPFNSGVSFAQGGDIAIGRGTTYPSTQMRFILDNGTNNPTNPQATIMALDSSGNVGIGTTSPGHLFHVYAGDGVAVNSYTALVQNAEATAGDNFGLKVQAGKNSSDVTMEVSNASGSSYIRVRGDGNVGIGTTNPGAKLNVVGTGTQLGTSGYYYNTFLKDTTNSGVLLGGNNTTNGVGFLAGVNELAFLTFGTSWGERMRIDSAGNVGIGTTSPVGNLFVGPTWSQTGGNDLYIKSQTTTTSYDPSVNNTQDLGITYNTSSTTTTGPDKAGLVLHNDAGVAGEFSPMIIFSGREATPSQFKAAMAGIYARSPLGTGNGGSYIDGELIFATAGAATQGIVQRMVINKEGLVGIGTTSPSESLEISKSANHGIKLSRPSSGSNPGDVLMQVHSSGKFLLTADNDVAFTAGTSTEGFVMKANTGNVGIGVTGPQKKLSVYGDTLIESSGFTASLWFRPSATYGAGGIQTMKVTGSGNPYHTTTSFSNYDAANVLNIVNDRVGIGTTGPTVKLHISESSSASTVNLLYLENTGSGGSEGVSIKFNPMFGATSMIASNREGADSGKTNLTFHNCLVNDAAPIERMRITSAGNVGIGKTNPAVPLDVEGKIRSNDSNSGDYLEIFCDGSASGDSYIENTNNNIQIKSASSIIFSTSSTTALTLDTSQDATFAGNVKLGPSSSVQLDDTPTASTASGSGTVVNWSVSETVTAGTLYAVKTNGGWTTADADSEPKSTYMLAIALGSNATAGMLLQGFFYKSSHGFTIGAPLYISNTAGAFSNSRPTGSGDYVRIIGYATSTNYIYFDPDKTWVKIA